MIFDIVLLALIGGLIWAFYNHKITLNDIENAIEGEIDWLKTRISSLESMVDKK